MKNGKITTIYLVRHGESISNAHEKRPYTYHTQWGDTEAPLTQFGIEQAKKRAESLQHVQFDAVFSSDLTRAINTAEIINLNKNLKVQTTRLLRERDVARYFEINKEKSKEVIIKEIREALIKLDEKGKMNYKHWEGIESAQEAAERLVLYLRDISANYAGKTVLVVCHGNVMRSFLTYLGYVRYDELSLGSIKNTGYIVLECDGENFTVIKTEGVHRRENSVRDL